MGISSLGVGAGVAVGAVLADGERAGVAMAVEGPAPAPHVVRVRTMESVMASRTT